MTRVLLSPFLKSDITASYVSWLNDPVVVRFSNQRFRTHTAESCLDYLRSFEGSDNMFLAVRLADRQRFIGTVTAYVNRHHGTADMGLMIGDRTEWGKGYGLEAWQILMRRLFDEQKMRKITGGTLDCNTAMKSIMEKSGMQLEAVRSRQEIVDGVPRDMLYFAVFGDD